MAPARSPTVPLNLAITSSTSSLQTSMCQVFIAKEPLNTDCGAVLFSIPKLSQSLSVCTGSAFTVKVTGEGRMKESITRKRRAASVANVGSQCDLSLKIPGD